jgi:hypothetical protein
MVGEFRIGSGSSTYRPSILFSTGYNSDTWSVGFGYFGDSNFKLHHPRLSSVWKHELIYI